MPSDARTGVRQGSKMQWANSKTRYGAVPQIVHWLTAIFVICGFLLGQFGDDCRKARRANSAFSCI